MFAMKILMSPTYWVPTCFRKKIRSQQLTSQLFSRGFIWNHGIFPRRSQKSSLSHKIHMFLSQNNDKPWLSYDNPMIIMTIPLLSHYYLMIILWLSHDSHHFFPPLIFRAVCRQATEASRLHRCLEGHDVALSQKAVALHIFRQAPVGSSAMGLSMVNG